MTLEEIQEFLKNKHDNKPIEDGDRWAAVLRPENPELHDFVQIGSGHSLGLSHTDAYGVPSWGDIENSPGTYREIIMYVAEGC